MRLYHEADLVSQGVAWHNIARLTVLHFIIAKTISAKHLILDKFSEVCFFSD